MSLRITNDVAGLTAMRYLDKSQRQAQKSLEQLASGHRIVHAGDDAAGFAIAENLKAQLTGDKQAQLNGKTALSMLQTAEGALNEQNNILIRLRELAVSAASDTVSDRERSYLNDEFQQLGQEFDRIAKTTTFGHRQLLTGSGRDYSFQVGTNQGSENTIEFKLDSDTTASSVGVDDLAVDDQDDARDSLESIDEALQVIAGARAKFGAVQSRFQYAIDALSAQAEDLAVAHSNIMDVDVASAVTNLTRANILQQMGTSVLAQANGQASRVLRLLS